MVRSLLRDWAKSWALRFSRGATLCICLLGLLSSSPGVAAAVAEFSFDIPATTLDDALTRFSEQSGYSVGMAGTLPRLRSAPLSGRFTAHQALTTLLAGSGLVAVPLGAAAFRLEPRAQTADRVSVPRAAAQVEALDEVVVTAAKRRQDFRTIPLSMTVVSGDDIDAGMLPAGSRSAHLHDVTTSSTNLGPGRERQFIRGIADSPFLGPSQATVSVQFDDARATYDAPDPDLVLLDIEQVEILKGPQGPLYGTGALGGVFHIVPRRPELDRASWQSTVQLQKVQSGGAGFGADVVVNTPVVPGRAALRAVAYTSTEPGWIDNSGARDNANGTRILGGRLALRTLLPADWTLDLQGVAQNSQTTDSQYVTGSSGLRRSGVLPEPHDSDFYLGVATAQGRWLGLNALVTTSAVSHESDGILDASAAAGLWGETAPLRYRDKRRYRLFNEEVRLWSNADARVAWLLGASYVSARSALTGSLEPGQSASRDVLRLVQQAGELAVFGEASARITGALRATGGASCLSQPDRQRRARRTAAGGGRRGVILGDAKLLAGLGRCRAAAILLPALCARRAAGRVEPRLHRVAPLRSRQAFECGPGCAPVAARRFAVHRLRAVRYALVPHAVRLPVGRWPGWHAQCRRRSDPRRGKLAALDARRFLARGRRHHAAARPATRIRGG
jgi:hypothetical protein